jgi:hypothetical protein
MRIHPNVEATIKAPLQTIRADALYLTTSRQAMYHSVGLSFNHLPFSM